MKQLIQNQSENCSSCSVLSNHDELPSLFVCEIEKQNELKTTDDYRNFIKQQIYMNHAISSEQIDVQIVINDPNYETVSCIINANQKCTINRLNQLGNVKIGYKLCPIKSTKNINQCIRCWKFGNRPDFFYKHDNSTSKKQ